MERYYTHKTLFTRDKFPNDLQSDVAAATCNVSGLGHAKVPPHAQFEADLVSPADSLLAHFP
jgi:hypothetical protein